MENNQEKKEKFKPIIMKSLFVVMIFAIIVILAFAIIRFIPFVFSSFASVGSVLKSPFEKELVLVANETDIRSGEVFRLRFEYEPEEEGYYSLSYECAPNLSISVNDQNGSELECNRNYRISPNDTFIDLKPTLNKENFYTETNISVSYKNRANTDITKDSILISVVNESGLPIDDLSGSATISSQNVDSSDSTQDDSTVTNTNSGTTPTNTSYVAPTPSLPPDLRVLNARALGDTVVVFDVSNIGGQPSGNWYFNYTIPGESVERSPLQLSLNPGESIRYTLRFEEIDSGNTIIMVDPNNFIRENSESNNTATVFLRGDGGSDSRDYDRDDYYYDRNDDADLEIRNLEVGRMRGSRFIEDNKIDKNDDAAVRFEVVNIGGESTGSWRFEIDNIPYDDDNEYRSGRQRSLRPGESVILTIEFENPDEGRYRIKVDVDSDDDVDEEDERNNDDSETLEVEG